jgi:hypothetical protein
MHFIKLNINILDGGNQISLFLNMVNFWGII